MTISLPRIPVPPAWARLLPGTSRWFGPPRRCASVAEYARRAPLETLAAGTAENVPAPSVVTFGPVDAAYVPERAVAIPAPRVFRLQDAAVYGPDAHLVAPDDTFLWDAAWHRGGELTGPVYGRKLFWRRRGRPRRRLAGRTAVIGSDWAIGGFGHFLTDALPRWRLLQDGGHAGADFDQIVLYHPGTPPVLRLLAAAGIPADRLVPYDERCDLECAEMVATTFPGAAPAISPDAASWLRRLVPDQNPREAVYLTRQGWLRHPANADEIERELAHRGYRAIQGAADAGTLDACAHARIIIGVEGANLFNVCFAAPGTRVIVLLPHPGVLPYIPWLCRAAQLPVAVVAAKPGSSPDAPVFPMADLRLALDWAMNAATDRSLAP